MINNNKVPLKLQWTWYILIYFSDTAACPVKGQVRVDCATTCVVTCANMNSLSFCPEICQLNGCECPQGTVINEKINTCVRPADCNSTRGIIG